MKRIEGLRAQLPPFCGAFFLGIAQTTSTLTRLNYAYDLRIFFEYLRENVESFVGKSNTEIKASDLDAITTLDIELYAGWLSTRQINGKLQSNSPVTLMRKLASLRSFFAHLFKKGMITKNVLPTVDLPKLHEKPITRLDKKEVGKVLDATQTPYSLTDGQRRFYPATALRDETIIVFFLTTGIRVSELVGLDASDVDMDNGSFRVTRKGGNQEILFMPEELKDQMDKYFSEMEIEHGEKRPLFLSLQNKRICTRAVQNLVKKYSRVAVPLKNISPHKLRSTFGTNLYKATGDIYVVASMLGHKDVNTTKKHYAAITDDIRKAAAERVRLIDDE